MSSKLTPLHYSNGEFDLTFRPDGRGGWWIPAAPVVEALGFRDASAMTRTVPSDEKGSVLEQTPGGPQEVLYLTLPGFFRVIGQRQAARVKDKGIRDKVERFQAWNFGEVLPAIAATGRYEMTPPGTDVAVIDRGVVAERIGRRELALMVLEAEDARDAAESRADVAEAKVAELEPAADAWGQMVAAGGDLSLTAAAKALQSSGARVKAREFFLYLHEKRWTYRAGGVGDWMPYAEALDEGWMTTRLVTDHDGKTKPQARVTVLGMERLRSMLVTERGGAREYQTSLQLVVAR